MQPLDLTLTDADSMHVNLLYARAPQSADWGAFSLD